jgi:hypothetical protein
MIKGNARIDDMSSQGSFMVRQGSNVQQSELGFMMAKGGVDDEDDQHSFNGSDAEGPIDDTEFEKKNLGQAQSMMQL